MGADVIVVIAVPDGFPREDAEEKIPTLVREHLSPRLLRVVCDGNAPNYDRNGITEHIRFSFHSSTSVSAVSFAHSLRHELKVQRNIFAESLGMKDVALTCTLFDGTIQTDCRLEDRCSEEDDEEEEEEESDVAKYDEVFMDLCRKSEDERNLKERGGASKDQTRIIFMVTSRDAVLEIAQKQAAITFPSLTLRLDSAVDGPFALFTQPLKQVRRAPNQNDEATPTRQRTQLSVLVNSPTPHAGFALFRDSWAFNLATSFGFVDVDIPDESIEFSFSSPVPQRYLGSRVLKVAANAEDESLIFNEEEDDTRHKIQLNDDDNPPSPEPDNAIRKSEPTLSESSLPITEEKPEGSGGNRSSKEESEKLHHKAQDKPAPDESSPVIENENQPPSLEKENHEEQPGAPVAEVSLIAAAPSPQRSRPSNSKVTNGPFRSRTVPTAQRLAKLGSVDHRLLVQEWVRIDSSPSEESPDIASPSACPSSPVESIELQPSQRQEVSLAAEPNHSEEEESSVHREPSTRDEPPTTRIVEAEHRDAEVQVAMKRQRRRKKESPAAPHHKRSGSADALFHRLSQPKDVSRNTAEHGGFRDDHDAELHSPKKRKLTTPSKPRQTRSKPPITKPKPKPVESTSVKPEIAQRVKVEKRKSTPDRDVFADLYQRALKQREMQEKECKEREAEVRQAELAATRPSRFATPEKRLSLTNASGARERDTLVTKIASALHADPSSKEAVCLLPPMRDKLPQTAIDGMAKRLFLAGQKARKVSENEKKRQAKEEEHCTFAPKISARARSTSRGRSPEDTSRRLYQLSVDYQKHQAERIERKERDAIDKIIKERINSDHHFAKRASRDENFLDHYRQELVRSRTPRSRDKSPDTSCVTASSSARQNQCNRLEERSRWK